MSEAAASDNVVRVIPFLTVTDISASTEFYGKLGFEIVSRWENDGALHWCQIELGGAALMLQVGGDAARPRVCDAGISTYFICRDALAIHSRAERLGLSPDEPFVGNAMWVVGLHDPDGYRLYFESETDVPEETRLSQL
ncbi:MAG: VOC family protein [Gemmatimonadota bacterium]